MNKKRKEVKNRIVTSLIFGFLFFALPLILEAQTGEQVWYIAPNGSNSNNCTTPSSPCLTFGGAQAKAGYGPGDIVQFAPGDYRSNFVIGGFVQYNITVGGTAAEPIIIRGHDGSGCPAESSSPTRGGYTVGTDPFHPSGVRANPSVMIERWVIKADYVTLDCFNVAQMQTVNDLFYISGADRKGISIINNTGNGWTYKCRHGVYGDNVPPADYPSNIYVADNYFTGCTTGINAGWNNSIVEQNEISRLGGTTRDYMRAGGDGVTMRKNYMYGTDLEGAPGAHVDCVQQFIVPASPDHMFKNFVYDSNVCLNSHQGIITEDSSTGARTYTGKLDGALIINNIFAHGVGGVNDPYENGAWCLAVGNMANVQAYHNTCVNFINGFGFGGSGTEPNFTAKNNLIVAVQNAFSITGIGSIIVTDNIIWSPPCGNSGVDEDGVATCGRTYGSFHMGPYTDNQWNINPLLINILNLDFHLLSNSPAINAGATGLGVSDDFENKNRDSAPDVGAYEYSSDISYATPYATPYSTPYATPGDGGSGETGGDEPGEEVPYLTPSGGGEGGGTSLTEETKQALIIQIMLQIIDLLTQLIAKIKSGAANVISAFSTIMK